MESAVGISIGPRLGSGWNQPDCRALHNLMGIVRLPENHWFKVLTFELKFFLFQHIFII